MGGACRTCCHDRLCIGHPQVSAGWHPRFLSWLTVRKMLEERERRQRKRRKEERRREKRRRRSQARSPAFGVFRSAFWRKEEKKKRKEERQWERRRRSRAPSP